MGEVVHTSRIKIVREKGPTRKAIIEGFNEPVYYGVHGGIKKFYKNYYFIYTSHPYDNTKNLKDMNVRWHIFLYV